MSRVFLLSHTLCFAVISRLLIFFTFFVKFAPHVCKLHSFFCEPLRRNIIIPIRIVFYGWLTVFACHLNRNLFPLLLQSPMYSFQLEDRNKFPVLVLWLSFCVVLCVVSSQSRNKLLKLNVNSVAVILLVYVFKRSLVTKYASYY